MIGRLDLSQKYESEVSSLRIEHNIVKNLFMSLCEIENKK